MLQLFEQLAAAFGFGAGRGGARQLRYPRQQALQCDVVVRRRARRLLVKLRH